MSGVVHHQSPEAAKSLMIVNMMKDKLGVKLLAFDFDLTLMDIVTRDNELPPEKLERAHLRSCFRSIITAAIKVGLQTCVVSYNYRKEMIAGVLKSAFPSCNTDEKIPIEIYEKTMYLKIQFETIRWGKEKHIKRVLRRLKEESGKEIQPEEIFLFDDYGPNIRNASKNKHLTFQVRNDVALDSIYSHLDEIYSKKKGKMSGHHKNGKGRHKRGDAEKAAGHVDVPEKESHASHHDEGSFCFTNLCAAEYIELILI